MAAARAGMRAAGFLHAVAGLYPSTALADRGAVVITVEPPEGGAARGQQTPEIGGDSAAFLSHGRNRRGVALDPGQEEGRAVA